MASIYREFLRSGEVVITVGEEDLTYSPPELLNSPFWDTDRGPRKGAVSKEWSIPLDFELSDSWTNDTAPNRPPKPPRIRGWMGILKEGSTKSSGAALIWKKKVVVGAGTMAQGDEDSYRPSAVFGATTTFPFQRLVGEVDVSDLQVTTFKDQIDWREGQEEELQRRLREALDDGDDSIMRMARNYRSTLKSKDASNTVQRSLQDAGSAAKGLLEAALSPTAIQDDQDEATDVIDESETIRTIIPVQNDPDSRLIFEVIINPGQSRWLSLKNENGSDWVLSVNREAPFMKSFANLPGADLDPILRLALGIGLSEIAARNSGVDAPAFIRSKLNQMLEGELSSRMESKEKK